MAASAGVTSGVTNIRTGDMATILFGPGVNCALKQEYDDGKCKYERKLEKNGDYNEEMKRRDGRPRRISPA
jgi:hypothetical protein